MGVHTVARTNDCLVIGSQGAQICTCIAYYGLKQPPSDLVRDQCGRQNNGRLTSF